MKKYLMALLSAGILGAAWAEEAAPCASESCVQPCLRKVCCPEPTTVKTTKTVYEEKCIEFCVPKCSCLLNCGGCCEKPHTKKVLVKRTITCECPGTKCELRIVADQPCATQSCATGAETIIVAPKDAPKPLPLGK
jgi:hypothetical protein